MSDPSGVSNSGPLLEGLSALVLAVTGGVATVVGLIRAGNRKAADPVLPPASTEDPGNRLADVLLDMHSRDLQAQDHDYRQVVKRMHRLEDLLTRHGIPLPLWREDDDE